MAKKWKSEALRTSLTFKQEAKGPLYVSYLPSIRFFVSRSSIANHAFTVEPLTISRFIRAVVVNLFLLNYWKLIRFLVWRCDAFATEENMLVSWKEFKPFLGVKRWVQCIGRRFRKICSILWR